MRRIYWTACGGVGLLLVCVMLGQAIAPPPFSGRSIHTTSSDDGQTIYVWEVMVREHFTEDRRTSVRYLGRCDRKSGRTESIAGRGRTPDIWGAATYSPEDVDESQRIRDRLIHEQEQVE